MDIEWCILLHVQERLVFMQSVKAHALSIPFTELTIRHCQSPHSPGGGKGRNLPMAPTVVHRRTLGSHASKHNSWLGNECKTVSEPVSYVLHPLLLAKREYARDVSGCQDQ